MVRRKQANPGRSRNSLPPKERPHTRTSEHDTELTLPLDLDSDDEPRDSSIGIPRKNRRRVSENSTCRWELLPRTKLWPHTFCIAEVGPLLVSNEPPDEIDSSPVLNEDGSAKQAENEAGEADPYCDEKTAVREVIIRVRKSNYQPGFGASLESEDLLIEIKHPSETGKEFLEASTCISGVGGVESGRIFSRIDAPSVVISSIAYLLQRSLVWIQPFRSQQGASSDSISSPYMLRVFLAPAVLCDGPSDPSDSGTAGKLQYRQMAALMAWVRPECSREALEQFEGDEGLAGDASCQSEEGRGFDPSALYAAVKPTG